MKPKGLSLMLTPQEINDKGFNKVMLNGYDMGEVDDFLESVAGDYNALYKENAILKGKLKVLVEKVEEYRSTEDAMRMALLTAQRMGEEITVEANRAKDEMLQKTDIEVKAKLTDTAKRVADEEMRLAIATKETAKFIDLSQAIMRKHSEFLGKLEAARRAVKPKGDPKQAALEPEPAAKASRPAKPAQPPPPPVIPAQPAQQAVSAQEIDDIALQIGSVVEQMADGDAAAAEDYAPASGEASLFDDDDGSVKLYGPDETTEDDTSPRPKFDFDDLKFGANFDGED